MPEFYGVRTIERPTELGSPMAATSGITVAFGTAPVHQVDGAANEIVIANTYAEAVSALGYSDNWEKYTLCEVMYAFFKLYGMGPLILINVYDPDQHNESVAAASKSIVDGQIELPEDAIAKTVTVKKGEADCVAGTDYDVFYEDGKCIVEVLTGGALVGETSAIVAYKKAAFTLDSMASEVIGGYSVATGKSTGLELLDFAYFKGLILPDLVIAPGFSHKPEVAAVMAAKTTFSTVFRAHCVCDLNAGTATTYQQAATLKMGNVAFNNTKQLVCWPKLGLGDLEFYASTQIAASMCSIDAGNNNIPSMVPSNKPLKADRAILEDGTEILLDLDAANFLRGKGIVTAYRFVNGFTAWGAYTAAFPDNKDPKDSFINISRMFGYVSNTIVLTYWSRVDERLTPRYAESIGDDLNMWLNGLRNSGDLLGSRVELKSEENPVEDLLAGIVRVHIYMTPPAVGQEIDFLLEYDVNYVSALLGGSAG